MTPQFVKPLDAGTFHSLGASMLRSNAHLLEDSQLPPGFTIYDQDDKKRMLKRLMQQRQLQSLKAGHMHVNAAQEKVLKKVGWLV